MALTKEVSQNIDGSKSNKLTLTILLLAVSALFYIIIKVSSNNDNGKDRQIEKIEKRLEIKDRIIALKDSLLSACGRESLNREIERSNKLENRDETKNIIVKKIKN